MEGRPLGNGVAGTPWKFGVEPLAESLELASRLRAITGLVLSLEATHPALARLVAALREAEAELALAAPADLTPRIGADAPTDRRVYIDHSGDVGAYNPCFPTYRIRVEGDRASGTVTFPLAYEGPPGLVHGGFLAVFFDSVVQHQNCELGLAGKTTSLTVRFRRPTPLFTELAFEVERTVEGGRIRSTVRLTNAGDLCCEAEVSAVAGNRAALPESSPRRAAT